LRRRRLEPLICPSRGATSALEAYKKNLYRIRLTAKNRCIGIGRKWHTWSNTSDAAFLSSPTVDQESITPIGDLLAGISALSFLQYLLMGNRKVIWTIKPVSLISKSILFKNVRDRTDHQLTKINLEKATKIKERFLLYSISI